MTCVLDDVGFLQVSGKDAVKFLQGYSTCDLDNLQADTGHRTLTGAICDIRGRMITSFRILKRHDALILRMHRPLVPKTIDFLSKYIVFSKASLTDISALLHCYGLARCEHNTANTYHEDGDGVTLNLGDRQEIWLTTRLEDRQETNRQDWALAEIKSGIVWVEEATSGQFIPQMFNYDKTGAIDFDKGCYLGQEVVARIQYRGTMKRRLHRLASRVSRNVGCAISGGTVVASVTVASATVASATVASATLSQEEGGYQLLAVLQNTNADKSAGLSVQFDDGEKVPAVPV